MDVLPIAIRMLCEDPSRYVRKEARRALEQARDGDPDPLVRKVAGWHAPGGPIYRRLAPKPARKTREQLQADRLAKRLRKASSDQGAGPPAERRAIEVVDRDTAGWRERVAMLDGDRYTLFRETFPVRQTGTDLTAACRWPTRRHAALLAG